MTARVTKAARSFIARRIRQLIRKGDPAKQAEAIAYREARKRGFKVPTKPTTPRRRRARPVTRRHRRNPAIAILGNPGAVRTLSSHVYEVRYRHAQNGKNYKHSFGDGVRATLLDDGRVVLWHPTKRLWDDL